MIKFLLSWDTSFIDYILFLFTHTKQAQEDKALPSQAQARPSLMYQGGVAMQDNFYIFTTTAFLFTHTSPLQRSSDEHTRWTLLSGIHQDFQVILPICCKPVLHRKTNNWSDY